MPDAIISDIGSPDMTGLAFVRACRADARTSCVHLIHALRPWRVSPRVRDVGVVELPGGVLAYAGVRLGDRIRIG